jgi:carbon-monoxide dehydrogenase large subunit
MDLRQSAMNAREAAIGIGASVRRIEDQRFLRGLGRYVDDIRFPGESYMVVVRSPHAAAWIRNIDTTDAASICGVLAVLTGADAEADGLGPMRTSVQRNQRNGSPMVEPPYRHLCVDQVRFAGDAVAIVVAETLAIAQEAAEAVAIDYEATPAITDVVDAVKPQAPAVWSDVPDNVSFVFSLGDRAAVDAAFAGAHHISTLDFRITRVSANAIEPRSAVAIYDPADARYTLYAGTQIPHKIRSEIANNALRIPETQLRIVSPDVGGAFGMKGSPYPEYSLALWAAKRVQRPVRWTATRGESLLSDYHARDNVTTAQLALSESGEFLALRVRTLANLGAYLSFNTPHPPTNNLGGLAGVYRTPHIHAEVQGIYTHTQPTAPYRGAGRPEATFTIERMIDLAAREMGIDRVELRRRNLIHKDQMPFKTGLVFTYDSGDFEKNIDLALRAADWDGFEARREDARKRNRLRGISLVHPIEISGGPFRNPNEEGAEIRFDPNGDVTLLMGTHNHGQGHETVFRQIIASFLGIDPTRVRVFAGDTDVVRHGRGTFGSRSVMSGGSALRRAADIIIDRAKILAALSLEADASDLEFSRGEFRVSGTDRTIRIEELAKLSYRIGALPPGSDYGLAAGAIVVPEEATFPNGCHICEVEIDPETGQLDVVNYVVVDDVGTVINPLLVKGQIHGGLAQGIGQAVQEAVVYDTAGQMLSGSFMDYAMPRARLMPPIEVISNEVPTAKNVLGVKGAGEAGTVGSLIGVTNAVLDALRPAGVADIAMPLSAARIWQALHDASRKPDTHN